MRNLVLMAMTTAIAVCAVTMVRSDECEAAAKPKTVTVKGIVEAKWDDDWNATGVTVKDKTKKPPVVYRVTLDAKGKALADEMEGEEVEVAGLLSEDKATKINTLTVRSYKAVRTPEVAEEDPEEAAEVPKEGDE